MALAIPRTLKNFNLYVKEVNYAGKAYEISLPPIEVKIDVMSVGGFTEYPIFTGEISQLQVEFKVTELSQELQSLVGIFPKKTTITAYGAISDDNTTESQPTVVIMEGWIHKYSPSAYSVDNTTMDSYTASLTYFRYMVNGKTTLEIDLNQNIYKVNGIDIVEEIRSQITV